MQKLPEASNRKRGDACTKRNPLGQRKKPVLFQEWSAKSFLLLVGGPIRPSLGGAMANLSLVAAVSVNIQPKYKRYQMDLSNCDLKHQT